MFLSLLAFNSFPFLCDVRRVDNETRNGKYEGWGVGLYRYVITKEYRNKLVTPREGKKTLLFVCCGRNDALKYLILQTKPEQCPEGVEAVAPPEFSARYFSRYFALNPYGPTGSPIFVSFIRNSITQRHNALCGLTAGIVLR
jgi:hypothetical protein